MSSHNDVLIVGAGQAGLAPGRARLPGPPALVTGSPGLHFLGLPWQHTRNPRSWAGSATTPPHFALQIATTPSRTPAAAG
jgi:hypothetical protein